MKQLIYLLFFSSSLCSCVTVGMYNKEAKKVLIPGYEVLVVKNNGEKIGGKKLITKFDRKGRDWVFTVDETVIAGSEIYGYQYKNGFYRRYGTYFEKMLRRGKINLYYEDYHSDQGSVDVWLFEKGNSGMLEPSKKGIAELLADNPAALARFNNLYKRGDRYSPRKISLKNIISIVDLYNQ